ncbi:MAG TPA: AarF/ABC1/UbiB kinase family protein [Acidimicrobiales bacterium]|jgi:predicted unusual protein kinase regulating ubiquinone biosynthesis (AarF/ABC1/UbiB family)
MGRSLKSARRLVLFAGGVGTGVVVYRRFVVPRNGSRERTALASSRQARGVQVARLATRVGGAYASHRAQRLFASEDRKRELDERLELRTATEVTQTLGEMKGVLMKVGQLASFLDDGLPENLRASLAELQHEAPPMSADLAAGVIEAELGQPPDRLFAEWDPVPIASASIGQVHRATTHDGQRVAIKVQYPGVDAAIRADLDNVGPLVQLMGMLFPALEPEPIVQELRSRLLEELDYRNEARNQQFFADAYRDHPFIHVPAVVDELSADRVLTSELAEGARFAEMETWEQSECDLAAETLFRFVFRSLFRLHAFNGDPHPGNYLFQPGGHVTFLDYGLVRRFDPSEVRLLEDMITGMVINRDLAEFRAVIERAGVLSPGAPIPDERIADYVGLYYDFVRDDKVATLTAEYASATARRFVTMQGPFRDVMRWTNLPPAFVILQRINLGLYAILGRLRATANWRLIAEELWPMTNGAPSTELGRMEHEWLARRP